MDNELVEENKNNTNKILIAIIILLLLALGGLSYYTFFVRDKEVDKPNPIVEPTNPTEPTVEKINYEVKKEGEDNYTYLYVNGVKVKEKSGNDLVALDDMKVTEFNDLLIVEILSPDSYVIAVDKEGKTIDFNTSLYNKTELNYSSILYLENKIDEINLYIKSRVIYSQGNLYAFCDHKSTDPYEYEVKFEYLGNGKFSDGVISKVTTIAEYDETNANINCSDRNN